jgi:hypothetical protein
MNSAGTLSQKYKVIVVYQKHIFTFQQRNALHYLVYIFRKLVSSVKMYALFIFDEEVLI